MGLPQGLLLFLRDHGIGVNPKHEREERVDEPLNVSSGHLRKKLLQAAGDRPDGVSIGDLEGHEIFHPAVCLHIIVIHGHELQKPAAPLQGTGQRICELADRHPAAAHSDLVQVLDPGLILPLQQGQENLLFCVEIIVDQGAGERGLRPDVLERHILEIHGLIQLGAGADDLVLSGLGQLLRSLRHGWHFLSLLFAAQRTCCAPALMSLYPAFDTASNGCGCRPTAGTAGRYASAPQKRDPPGWAAQAAHPGGSVFLHLCDPPTGKKGAGC